MPEYLEEKQLVSAIRARFPTEAALTDHWFVQRGEDMAELIEIQQLYEAMWGSPNA